MCWVQALCRSKKGIKKDLAARCCHPSLKSTFFGVSMICLHCVFPLSIGPVMISAGTAHFCIQKTAPRNCSVQFVSRRFCPKVLRSLFQKENRRKATVANPVVSCKPLEPRQSNVPWTTLPSTFPPSTIGEITLHYKMADQAKVGFDMSTCESACRSTRSQPTSFVNCTTRVGGFLFLTDSRSIKQWRVFIQGVQTVEFLLSDALYQFKSLKVSS